MKKTLIVTTFLIFSSWLFAEFSVKALHCGPRGSIWGALGSDFFIPDYFPPEQWLVRLTAESILGDLSLCEEDYAPVYFGQSCQKHDQCYYTLGANKDSCDDDLYKGWRESCALRYEKEGKNRAYCLNACEYAADFMYNAMRYDDGIFCPSCTAFNKDQEEAALIAAR